MRQAEILIDEATARQNIRALTDKAAKHKLKFRPHFKTHQSAEIGNWIRDDGVDACAVSSLHMAEYFAFYGWKDIMIAFPFIPSQVKDYQNLAEKVELSLFISSPATMKHLAKISAPVKVIIELDTGNHRSGIYHTQDEIISELIRQINASSNLKFVGFAVHAGETYQAKTKNEVLDIHTANLEIFYNIRKKYPDALISYGDTPSAMLAEEFGQVNELRPGNFVFFDLMQQNIGSCSTSDIAMQVKCEVVDIKPMLSQVVVHCGAVHLSKDYLLNPYGKKIFGKVVDPESHGNVLPGAEVISLAQEHGIIRMNENQISKVSVGDFMRIYPVHSCLVADMAVSYTEFRSGRLIRKMKY